MRLPQPPLVVITDRGQAHHALDMIVIEACAAGCRWISVREKDLSEAEQYALMTRLAPIARAAGARLTLHGRAELARAARADGVHLPAEADAAAARAMLDRDALIGQSVHHAAEAARLDPAVVDYAIAGPAYATASKPGYGPALGPAGMAAICTASRVPIIAVGGIEPELVPAMRRAGAAVVAVMGSVMRAAEPRQRVEDLLGVLAPT